MLARRNFAQSESGMSVQDLNADYSVTSGGTRRETFNARQNTKDVVSRIVKGHMPSDALMFSAAAALQRQARMADTEEEWAERLSHEFFDELDRNS